MEKVEERALEIAKDFQKALDRVKDKREVIKRINDKIAGLRENLQAYQAKEADLLREVEMLAEQFTQSLSSNQDSETIHKKKVQVEEDIKTYQAMVSELERKVLPQLERDLQAANEEARIALNTEWLLLRSDYQQQLNETVDNTIVVELLAWRQAYNDIGKDLEIRVPVQPLRIKSREIESALL